MFNKVFRLFLPLLLLGIYVYLVAAAAAVARCSPQPGCPPFTEQMAWALSAIGSLVTAVVVAELAVTAPGETPVQQALGPHPSRASKGLLAFCTLAYVLVWLGTGFWAFVVTMRHTAVAGLNDIGHAWLALVIVSGYAYFGIKPKP